MINQKYQIERNPREGDDKSAYGFVDLWDENSIEEAIKQARVKNNPPRFILSRIEIHPSGECNLNCKFCYGKKLAPKKKENLSLEAIYKMFEDIRKDMPDEEPFIILSGLYSEPLTHPSIKEILKKLGDYKFRFALYSNGLLIDEEIINIVLESASKSKMPKPCYISFNISSALENKNFGAILKTIKKLDNKRKNYEKHILDINAPIIVFPEQKNFNYLKKIISKLDKAGADNIRLSFPLTKRNGKQIKNYKQISDKEYKRTIWVFEKLKKEFKKIKIRYIEKSGTCDKCFAMAMSLTVDSRGDIYPCPEVASLLYKRLSYGNIVKEKISDVWRSEKHLEMFKSLNPKKEKCVCCPIDKKFNKLCREYWK